MNINLLDSIFQGHLGVPKRGEGGGPIVLLALIVHPFERLGGRNRSLCLPYAYPPRQSGEVLIGTLVPRVVVCKVGRVRQQQHAPDG